MYRINIFILLILLYTFVIKCQLSIGTGFPVPIVDGEYKVIAVAAKKEYDGWGTISILYRINI